MYINKDNRYKDINSNYSNIISISNTLGKMVNPGGTFDRDESGDDLEVVMVDEALFVDNHCNIHTHYINSHHRSSYVDRCFVRTTIFQFSVN